MLNGNVIGTFNQSAAVNHFGGSSLLVTLRNYNSRTLILIMWWQVRSQSLSQSLIRICWSWEPTNGAGGWNSWLVGVHFTHSQLLITIYLSSLHFNRVQRQVRWEYGGQDDSLYYSERLLMVMAFFFLKQTRLDTWTLPDKIITAFRNGTG